MANVLTYVGEEWVVDRLVGSGTYSTLSGNFVGWGTGTGTANKTDTVLFTESTDPGSAARASGTNSVVSKTGTGTAAKWQDVATLASTSTQTISNAGTFTTNNSNILLIHGDFTGIALVSGDSIQFTFTLDPA